MPWIIEEKNFIRENVAKSGNKFMTGNGYMGYRGTMEEFGNQELVACDLSGLYDKYGDGWREPVNAPNGLFTVLSVEGTDLGLLQRQPVEHSQELDIGCGLHKRITTWDTAYGRVTVMADRFVSLSDVHLICLKYTVSAEKACSLRIITGIDSEVWDINGPHLEELVADAGEGFIRVRAATQELKVPVVVAEACRFAFDAEQTVEERGKSIFHIIDIKAAPGKEYTLHKYVSVYTGHDDNSNPLEDCALSALKAASAGYVHELSEHAARWKSRWDASDIVIEGDEDDQLALRYSIYQLQIIAPAHSSKLSIPARGLSGQTYKGAIFWDTEMFMLPFFLHTAPEVARSTIAYRIDSLEGARKKAAEYGFRGAFYAWESQENGEEACTDFNVTDVFTGRPVRTYFRDKQVHISADIAYAIWKYYDFTGDISVLLGGGAEVILECARFFCSYAYYSEDRDRYEILDVIGPDEYHERVNNNAFTSKMVHHTLDVALKTIELLKNTCSAELEQLIKKLDYSGDIVRVQRLKEKLYVPGPDSKTLVIEQFDGYNKLEDCTLEEVRKRLVDPKEYWGGGHGVATTTKIIKQADVVLMLYLFGNEYDREVKQVNWTYYEPRTEHGSSLSPCVYALLSCDIGNEEWAYPFFVKTANIDLTGESKQYAGLVYIGGTHPAASGGAWMTAVFGFAGLKTEDGRVTVDPHLPEKWRRLAFNVIVRGERYHINITHEGSQVTKIY